MTNLQEAKLAREAEICYATLALVTDYDCWHPDHDSVTVDLIIANLMQNAATAQKTIADAVEPASPARAPAPARTRSRPRSSRRRRSCPSRRRRISRRSSADTCGRSSPKRSSGSNEHRRHRFDRLRLPDVVSREVHRALPAGAHEPRQPRASSSTRWTSGAAAARRTSPTRWRCSASGRC